MKIQDSKALVTGANRGIGREIVLGLLDRGVGTVYCGARKPESLAELVEEYGERVVPLQLDITDEGQVREAAQSVPELDLLINNAGVLHWGSFAEGNLEDIRQDMETNYFGTLRMVRAFLPQLEKSGDAVIVNLHSVVSFGNMAFIGGYSASKAAEHSLTQALRSELGPKGIQVLGVYPGPVDTDMAKELEMDKTPPAQVAQAILDGVEAGKAYTFPDPMAEQVGATWKENPLAVETLFAEMAEM